MRPSGNSNGARDENEKKDDKEEEWIPIALQLASWQQGGAYDLIIHIRLRPGKVHLQKLVLSSTVRSMFQPI